MKSGYKNLKSRAVRDRHHSGKPAVISEAKEKCEPEMPVSGKKTLMRLDRPGRKRGGRVGADSSPLSAASVTSGACSK